YRSPISINFETHFDHHLAYVRIDVAIGIEDVRDNDSPLIIGQRQSFIVGCAKQSVWSGKNKSLDSCYRIICSVCDPVYAHAADGLKPIEENPIARCSVLYLIECDVLGAACGKNTFQRLASLLFCNELLLGVVDRADRLHHGQADRDKCDSND